MKTRHAWVTLVHLSVALLFAPMALSAFAQEPILRMVSNAMIKSYLMVDGNRVELSGRTSIYFEATEEEFSEGRLKVKGFNIVYFQVPQAALTYDKISEDHIGTLGFAIAPEKGPQYVSIDQHKGYLSAKLTGYVDADFMAESAGYPLKGEDYVKIPKQTADILFQMDLTNPLRFKDTGNEILEQKGIVAFHLNAYDDVHSDAKAYQLSMEFTPIYVETTTKRWIEVSKKIKIQPIRIAKIQFGYPRDFKFSYTGAGLNFGMSQIKEQWLKADVVVSVNDWITIWDVYYWNLDAMKATYLMTEVEVEDALEVFFVHKFSPDDMWGGGATWGLGISNSKIITSDGNARNGMDYSHLAHELGHAMGLIHPDGTRGVSTGTLMCPSDWMIDNPQVNSQENRDNISNPLFTFAFKLISTGPDCLESVDCGPCP